MNLLRKVKELFAGDEAPDGGRDFDRPPPHDPVYHDAANQTQRLIRRLQVLERDRWSDDLDQAWREK